MFERDGLRQTGRTTKQMQEAPLDAVFVWPHSASLNYARALALRVDRIDLNIISPNDLESPKWRGRKPSVIVLDHATELNERQRACYCQLTQMVVP